LNANCSEIKPGCRGGKKAGPRGYGFKGDLTLTISDLAHTPFTHLYPVADLFVASMLPAYKLTEQTTKLTEQTTLSYRRDVESARKNNSSDRDSISLDA
jgi:hypothetical protein